MKPDYLYGDHGELRKRMEEDRQKQLRAEEAKRQEFSRQFQRFCSKLGGIGRIQE